MEAVYDLEFFREELNLINDPEIKRLTEETLLVAPTYFWYVPSSITGKYHPPDDNEPGGLCWHSKKAAWLGYRMFDNLSLDTDIGLVAGLTHDIAHRGLEDKPDDDYESYQKHGELASYRLGQMCAVMDNKSSEVPWAMIGACVASHMGKWGNRKPETIEQTTFHLADVAASTRGLVNYTCMEQETGINFDYTIAEIVGKKEYFKEVDGELCFNFGKKHMGTPLKVVAQGNDSYLSWMIRQGIASDDNPKGFPEAVIEQVKDARKQLLDERRECNKPAQGELFETSMGIKESS